MDFTKYQIFSLDFQTDDTFILKIAPLNQKEVFPFSAGQFAILKDPDNETSTGSHSFSIASSPNNRKYLEFCVKIYGDWTKKIGRKKIGDIVEVSGPLGKFTWEDNIKEAVFLAGGIGIAPIMSMLRQINENKQDIIFYLFYGSRTPATILYKKEIEHILINFPKSEVIHVLSHLSDTDTWDGLRGFITPEIIKKEIKDLKTSTYFICGPQIFVQLMKKILNSFAIDPQKIKQELI